MYRYTVLHESVTWHCGMDLVYSYEMRLRVSDRTNPVLPVLDKLGQMHFARWGAPPQQTLFPEGLTLIPDQVRAQKATLVRVPFLAIWGGFLGRNEKPFINYGGQYLLGALVKKNRKTRGYLVAKIFDRTTPIVFSNRHWTSSQVPEHLLLDGDWNR